MRCPQTNGALLTQVKVSRSLWRDVCSTSGKRSFPSTDTFSDSVVPSGDCKTIHSGDLPPQPLETLRSRISVSLHPPYTLSSVVQKVPLAQILTGRHTTVHLLDEDFWDGRTRVSRVLGIYKCWWRSLITLLRQRSPGPRSPRGVFIGCVQRGRENFRVVRRSKSRWRSFQIPR